MGSLFRSAEQPSPRENGEALPLCTPYECFLETGECSGLRSEIACIILSRLESALAEASVETDEQLASDRLVCELGQIKLVSVSEQLIALCTSLAKDASASVQLRVTRTHELEMGVDRPIRIVLDELSLEGTFDDQRVQCHRVIQRLQALREASQPGTIPPDTTRAPEKPRRAIDLSKPGEGEIDL